MRPVRPLKYARLEKLRVCCFDSRIAELSYAIAGKNEDSLLYLTAGASPVFEGDPGYSFKLDRDKDGVACEN
ncbi:excalibur calcium-binding domain-containing protein [Paenibacillus sp. LHD-38]|uniref:excalibur calcium-binding domain-containing protein n=1 Tax=Paenibacillus sp. LHD-38 TaxID=3072143 RepID=UPI00280CFF12|nr:excalibur calcium-binding domain-containing protein [Paenibacillus sp. LHD-38]MDQ8735207.1 excalibur calcium-binding domain-containing protein [Paenibacillus sp. LHD-38]